MLLQTLTRTDASMRTNSAWTDWTVFVDMSNTDGDIADIKSTTGMAHRTMTENPRTAVLNVMRAASVSELTSMVM